ncbi:hypothetical protein BJV74DRAFT_808267 [Russula compacta]|nr:hypothetical protein BJV74DRAFT_808267 [Russula compacta]
MYLCRTWMASVIPFLGLIFVNFINGAFRQATAASFLPRGVEHNASVESQSIFIILASLKLPTLWPMCVALKTAYAFNLPTWTL